MAKIVLDTITGGYDLSLINDNFDKIEAEFQNKVLYRDNPVGEANTLQTDVDVNEKIIYNLPEPLLDSQAARLQDVQNAIAGGAANLIPFTPYKNISTNNIQSALQEEIDDLESTAGAGLVGILDAGLKFSGSTVEAALSETATLVQLAASSGSSLLGFLQAGTGATSRTVQSKLRDVVSVKDFGAVGDGVANDTAAIQAAVDTGRVVFVPAGTYKITASITLTSGGGLVGEGEKTNFVRFFTGGQLIRYPGGNSAGDAIILRDFRITCDASITVVDGDTGIDMGYVSQWGGRGEIFNIYIKGQWDGFKWKQGSMNPITSVYAVENKGRGFFGVNPRGELNSCLSVGNAGSGYYFYADDPGETGVQITTCGTFANQGWGFLFDGDVDGANIYCKGITASFDGLGGVGFNRKYTQVWFTQMLIEHIGKANTIFPAFPAVTNARGLSITNACTQIVGSDIYVQACNGGGVFFDGLSRASFTNLVVLDNGQANSGGAGQVGINFNANNTDVKIQGLIVNFGALQTTDIAESSTGNDVVISNSTARTFFNTANGIKFSGLNTTTTSSTVASASTITLIPYHNFFSISGTTTIDSITPSWAGRQVTLKFESTPIVGDANNLILASQFNTTANDTLTLICDGTNWYEVSRSAN